MSLNDGELDEIQRRAESAQLGPWRVDPVSSVGENWPLAFFGNDGKRDWVVATDQRRASSLNGAGAKEDAEFVAHARTDVPRLVAEVRRLGDEVARLAAETEDAKQRRFFA